MKLAIGICIWAILATVTSQSAVPSDKNLPGERGKNGDLFYIELEGSDPVDMTKEQVDDLITKGKHFIDLTNVRSHSQLKYERTALKDNAKATIALDYPKEIRSQEQAQPIIDKLSPDVMREFLNHFTSFTNRYARSSHGAKSAEWLYEYVTKISSGASNGLQVTVSKESHRNLTQPSIIARIPGQGNLVDEIVIIGAHQDSINSTDKENGRAPGADDDGSGSATVVEIFRRLVEARYQPSRTLEFHWYAGEEVGLVGSLDVATKYQKEAKNVYAMLQFDMTGYVPTGHENTMGLVTDNVNAELNEFLKIAATAYTNLKVIPFACGYRCSDHASWNRTGFPSTFPIESDVAKNNSYIHTENDTMDHLNFDHMLEFAKLGVGFAVELAGEGS
ncbi:hypothetical protein IWQ62_002850 [Dispira parvispora]|uniref:Peptide hydrolase n=1 Tax=Dispira parvispora TaxID=1520584 RepID=A0A9W8E6T2_9FUNG|nr:hypothetical protein IWQ62_002850 [Dispira parvispora]